jgi:ubiquinone biosynthesis protein COQ9
MCPFDGWSEPPSAPPSAIADVPLDDRWALFPARRARPGAGLPRRGDAAMVERIREADLWRDEVSRPDRPCRAAAAGDRGADKEAVRRGTTLFALPNHAAEGARAVWETADAIWTRSAIRPTTYNWYTKRATLSGVYSATVLYWLGDQSEGAPATWAFLDRRIEDVMQIETLKKQVRENRLSQAAFWRAPNWFASQIKRPVAAGRAPICPGAGGPDARKPPLFCRESHA